MIEPSIQLACAYSKDSNQSAHQSLNFLPEETLDLSLPIESDQTADPSLQWAHMQACTFCWTPAQMMP